MRLKDLPPDARPREKLLARGAAALSDVELLALLLRTGIKGKGVLQMADELLNIKNDSGSRNPGVGFNGVSGLLHATADDLKQVKGLGPAKRAELGAAGKFRPAATAGALLHPSQIWVRRPRLVAKRTNPSPQPSVRGCRTRPRTAGRTVAQIRQGQAAQ